MASRLNICNKSIRAILEEYVVQDHHNLSMYDHYVHKTMFDEANIIYVGDENILVWLIVESALAQNTFGRAI